MATPKTWTRDEIINNSGYVGKDLVLPEDREYFEGFMNRYYPNHNKDLADVTNRGRAANDKYMRDNGYVPAPEGYGWENSKTKGWTSGTWAPYNNLMHQFNETRKGTLLNEIGRKYPDWPDHYRARVADDVYGHWNDRFTGTVIDEPNKQSTQNIAGAVQGVM